MDPEELVSMMTEAHQECFDEPASEGDIALYRTIAVAVKDADDPVADLGSLSCVLDEAWKKHRKE